MQRMIETLKVTKGARGETGSELGAPAQGAMGRKNERKKSRSAFSLDSLHDFLRTSSLVNHYTFSFSVGDWARGKEVVLFFETELQESPYHLLNLRKPHLVRLVRVILENTSPVNA